MKNQRDIALSLIETNGIPMDLFDPEDLQILQNGGLEMSDIQTDNISFVHEQSQHVSFDGDQVTRDKLYSMKNTYQNHFRNLKDQNERLLAENQRIMSQKNLEVQKMRQLYETQNQKDGWELNRLRADQIKHENQFPLIREALTTVREMLNGLIPIDTYLRLKNLPSKDLNPNEWILVHTYELISPYSEENKKFKLENSSLKDEIRLMNQKSKQLLMELEHYQKLLSERDDDYKRYNMNYDNQKKALEIELKNAYEDIKLLRTKALKYDECIKENAKQEDEIEILKNKVKMLTPIDNEDIPGAFQTNNDLHRKIELLDNERLYLQKETIKLTEVNKRLDDKNEELENDLNESKRTVQKYLEELLQTKHNTTLAYEKRLNEDLAALREKNARELEMTKNNLTEIYEKQIRFLKDQKEDLEFKVETLGSQLREKQSQYEDLLKDGKHFQAKLDSELAELRIGHRVKSEEVERLRIDYEDTKNDLRASKAENEMLKDKLSVLRSEFYKAEAKSKDNTSDLRAEVSVLREKLKNYENIENEIDEAIMGFGGRDMSKGDNIYLNTIKSAPTSTQRRVQQALSLAQRLQKKQKELDEAKAILKDKESFIDTLQEELRVARELYEKTKQPQNYLVENLEEKERELIKLRSRTNQLQNENDYMAQNITDLESRLEESQLKVKNILMKRENIENIQNILLNMIENNKYMSPDEMKNGMREVRDMIREKPTRDDIMYHNDRVGDNFLMDTQKITHGSGTNTQPNWFKQLTSKKR